MKRHARVVRSISENSALLELTPVSHCQRCKRGKGCGAGALGGLSGAAPAQIECDTKLALEAGQNVLVEINESGSQWLWLVFGAYGLPLAGMLLSTLLVGLYTGSLEPVAGQSASNAGAELASMLAAVIGLAGGFIAWRVLSPRALDCVRRGLCLQSARIVAINPLSEREH